MPPVRLRWTLGAVGAYGDGARGKTYFTYIM
jgi:hypothetical protein